MTGGDELRQARIARLASGMADLEFRSMVVEVDGLHDVGEWRNAARLVARRGGWKIRTGVTPDGTRAWAARTDREVTPEEMRAAVETLSYWQAAAANRERDREFAVVDGSIREPKQESQTQDRGLIRELRLAGGPASSSPRSRRRRP